MASAVSSNKGSRTELRYEPVSATDINAATSTDMSGHEVTSIPEVEIDARGVTSTLKISSTSTVSGIPKVSKSSG